MEHTERQTNWKLPFFAIWTGQQLSWIGSAVAGFALVWWLTKTTGSATMLAIGTLLTILPGIVLGPFAGALVDRWNRRLVMLVADSVVALFSAWLAVLFWTGTIQIWHVYVIMLVRAVGGAFHWPAMTASTTLMVPKDHLGRVAGLNQTIGGAVNIISPPLGALLLSVLPLHGIMAIDVLTAAFAIVPLFFVHVPQPERATAAQEAQAKPTLWTDMREGLRYVIGWPGLLGICLLATLLNFSIMPAMSLMPLLITDHFGGEALQLGWMNSAWGVGLVLGGLLLGAWGGFKKRIVTVLAGIVGLGVGVLTIGLTPATIFPLALGAFFFGAVMNALCNGSAFALLQQVVVPEMQGRVFALVMTVCNMATPLSLAIAGPLADAVGVRALYVAGGIAQVILGIGGFFVPAIMSLENNNGNGHAVEEEMLETVSATCTETA
ncbi:MAG: MFS transporter [Anaerolineae bacterium]|nr:MFS transporter [Anaerolineae bacterium]